MRRELAQAMEEGTPAQWPTGQWAQAWELRQEESVALPVQQALEVQASDAWRWEAVLAARSLPEMEPAIQSIAPVPARDIQFLQPMRAEESTAAAVLRWISFPVSEREAWWRWSDRVPLP